MDKKITMSPIGVIHSPYKQLKDVQTQAAKGKVSGKLFGADCFSCARCLNVCPQDAIRYAFVFSKNSCGKLRKQPD